MNCDWLAASATKQSTEFNGSLFTNASENCSWTEQINRRKFNKNCGNKKKIVFGIIWFLVHEIQSLFWVGETNKPKMMTIISIQTRNRTIQSTCIERKLPNERKVSKTTKTIERKRATSEKKRFRVQKTASFSVTAIQCCMDMIQFSWWSLLV